MLPFAATVVYLSTTSCWYWLVLQWSLSTSQWGFLGWLAIQLMLPVTLNTTLTTILMSITSNVLLAKYWYQSDSCDYTFLVL